MCNIDDICHGSQTRTEPISPKTEQKSSGVQERIVKIHPIPLRCETVTYKFEWILSTSM